MRTGASRRKGRQSNKYNSTRKRRNIQRRLKYRAHPKRASRNSNRSVISRSSVKTPTYNRRTTRTRISTHRSTISSMTTSMLYSRRSCHHVNNRRTSSKTHHRFRRGQCSSTMSSNSHNNMSRYLHHSLRPTNASILHQSNKCHNRRKQQCRRRHTSRLFSSTSDYHVIRTAMINSSHSGSRNSLSTTILGHHQRSSTRGTTRRNPVKTGVTRLRSSTHAPTTGHRRYRSRAGNLHRDIIPGTTPRKPEHDRPVGE